MTDKDSDGYSVNLVLNDNQISENQAIRNQKVGRIMNILARCGAIVIVCHVAFIAIDNVKLFSLHPTFMTIGYLLFMAEAIVALSPNGSILAFKDIKKAKLHWILQVIATSFILIGFLSIVIVKFQHNKPHFATWHALIGLIALICVLGTNLGGISALYSLYLKDLIPPSKVKAIHATFGIITFCLGMFSLILGFYTGWFTRNAKEVISFVYSIIVLLFTFALVINPIKNVAVRLRK